MKERIPTKTSMNEGIQNKNIKLKNEFKQKHKWMKEFKTKIYNEKVNSNKNINEWMNSKQKYKMKDWIFKKVKKT